MILASFLYAYNWCSCRTCNGRDVSWRVARRHLDSPGVSKSVLSVPAHLNAPFFLEALLICSKTVERQKVANL